MENKNKIVNFQEYCHKCKHVDCAGDQEPCNECLSNSTNVNSHKPVKYEEKGIKKTNRTTTI